MQVVKQTEERIDDRQPRGAQQHQDSPAIAVHGPQGNDREHHIDRARNHDVEQDIGDREAGCGEDFFRVVEDDVDTTPLLQILREKFPARGCA